MCFHALYVDVCFLFTLLDLFLVALKLDDFY